MKQILVVLALVAIGLVLIQEDAPLAQYAWDSYTKITALITTELASFTGNTSIVTTGTVTTGTWATDVEFGVPDDDTFIGIKRTFTAEEAIAFADPVYLSDENKIKIADADTRTTMPAIGVACAAISSGSTGEVGMWGFLRDDDGFAWATNDSIYVGTNNVLSTTVPSGTGDSDQLMGVAIEADIIFINPELGMVTR